MDITWLGTAGFSIRTGSTRFLIDPFVSRNLEAGPVPASRIFISHGHFDHLMDLPRILAADPEPTVHCSTEASRTLEKQGVSPNRIRRVVRPDYVKAFDGVSTRAFFSRHIRFDRSLVLSTLLRAHVRTFGLSRLFTGYPCGQVLSWRFELEGRSLHHFGSAGATDEELAALPPVDILLIPLQGHTDICRIAAGQVRLLHPRIVIPHHHDDFYPPISRNVDIRPFLDQVTRECPGTRIIVPDLNIPVHI